MWAACQGKADAAAALILAGADIGTTADDGKTAEDNARAGGRLAEYAEALRKAVHKKALGRLALLVALLLARQGQSLTDADGGVPCTGLAAAVVALPSGLLALIGEAITKLESPVEVQWASDAKRLQKRVAKSAELSRHTLVQLKALCTQHGLRKTGAKAEVVTRLCDTLCADEPAAKRPRMEPLG